MIGVAPLGQAGVLLLFELGFLATLAGGAMDKVGELLQRKRKLAAESAQVKRELREVKRRQKEIAAVQAKTWVLPLALQRVVLIIYALAAYEAEPAVKYLATRGRVHHWPEKAEEELEAMVGDLFLAVDERELAALTNPENPLDKDAFRSALGFVEQWRLVVWSKTLNRNQGVAPSCGSVLERYDGRLSLVPADVRPALLGAAFACKARMWALRWRRRWGGRHSKIRVRNDVSVEELRGKAGENKFLF